MRRQLIRLSGQAALGEHFQLGAEHVALRKLERLALGPAVLAALDVKDGCRVQQVRRIPGAEIDLVMHHRFLAEYAHREDAR